LENVCQISWDGILLKDLILCISNDPYAESKILICFWFFMGCISPQSGIGVLN